MAAAPQAFDQWIESQVAQDFLAFRQRYHMVSTQLRASGTMVRDLDGRGEPRLQAFASHHAVGNLMG